MLHLTRSGFLPYTWELLQRRPNAERLNDLLRDGRETHDFFTNYFQASESLVPIEEVPAVITAAKARVRQLNKSVAMQSLGSKLVFSKYEAVITVNGSELMAYVHCHVIFAVLKGANPRRIAKVGKESARITGLKFGRMWRGAEDWFGYFLKHPISLRWGENRRGSFARLSAVAKLTSEQAYRIYQSMQGVGFMSFAPLDLVLSTQIGNLKEESAKATVESIGKAEGMSPNAVKDWWEIEKQRRVFERAIPRCGLSSSQVAVIRARCAEAFQEFLDLHRKLGGLGDACRAFHINSTGRKGAVAALAAAIDAVELNL